jgi:MFS family permease
LRGLAVDVSPLQASRDYRLIFSGQLVSMIGRNITIVLVSLYAGAIADRVDRRLLLLIALLSQGATSLLLALGAVGLRAPLVYIYAVSAVASGFSAIELPSRAATIPRLVPPRLLPAALSLNQVLFQTGQVVGPAIAGIVIGRAGLPLAYLLDVASFVLAATTVWFIARQPPLEGASPVNLKAPLEAFRYVADRSLLLSIFAIDLAAMIFGLPRAVYPALATEVFRVGPGGLGLLYAAPGAGALVGALLTGWAGRVNRRGQVVIWSVVAWGVTITAFGFATLNQRLFALALVFLGLAGASDVFSAIFRGTILQLSVPDYWRGRMSAPNSMVVTTGPRLGDVETGVVASLTSPFVAVVSGGALALLGAVAVGLAMPALRRYRAEPEAEPVTA